ncbi:MAG: YCF48-related protein [Candidatus Eisenbacteria bacterium]
MRRDPAVPGIEETPRVTRPAPRRHRHRSDVSSFVIGFAGALSALISVAGSVQAGWDRQSLGTSVDLHDVTASHGSNAIAWACGDSGAIFHTTNAGATWVRQNSGTDRALYAIAFQELSGAPVLAAGEGGIMLRTTDQGQTWTEVESGVTQTLRDISDFGQVAVGDGGSIIHSPDGGLTWTVHTSNTTADLFAVTAAGIRMAVGENGAFLTAPATSSTWLPSTPFTDLDLFAIPMFFGRYVTAEVGVIFHSDNGSNWEVLPSGVQSALRGIEFSTNNTSGIYAVGDDGIILKTTDAGNTWGFQDSGVTTDLNAVFFYLADQFGWAVGKDGVVLHTSDGGGPIVPADAPEPSATVPVGSLTVSPNPANDRATLAWSLEHADGATLSIFDAEGRALEVLHEIGAGDHSGTVPLDLSRYPAGRYYLRLVSPRGTLESPLVHLR